MLNLLIQAKQYSINQINKMLNPYFMKSELSEQKSNLIRNLRNTENDKKREFIRKHLPILCQEQNFFHRNVIDHIPHSLANAILVLLNVENKTFANLPIEQQRVLFLDTLMGVLEGIKDFNNFSDPGCARIYSICKEIKQSRRSDHKDSIQFTTIFDQFLINKENQQQGVVSYFNSRYTDYSKMNETIELAHSEVTKKSRNSNNSDQKQVVLLPEGSAKYDCIIAKSKGQEDPNIYHSIRVGVKSVDIDKNAYQKSGPMIGVYVAARLIKNFLTNKGLDLRNFTFFIITYVYANEQRVIEINAVRTKDTDLLNAYDKSLSLYESKSYGTDKQQLPTDPATSGVLQKALFYPNLMLTQEKPINCKNYYSYLGTDIQMHKSHFDNDILLSEYYYMQKKTGA